MKKHTIYAIILRHAYLFRRSFDRLTDAFYWSTIDILIWGLTGLYITSLLPNGSTVLTVIISGIVFWYILWRSQYEITVNLLEELWDKNLINLFVSPLTFYEWITSFLFMGILKALLSLVFTSILAFVLYKVGIFSFGFYIIPFFGLLILSGWWVGFLVAGIIFRYGTRIQTLAWSMVAIISPFSAMYYPVSILPEWAQKVAAILPTSYVFEGIREVIQKGTVDHNKLIISFLLNILYITLTFIFLKRSFNKTLEKGLINVD
jgi:ABC-2 type transport system permease protein